MPDEEKAFYSLSFASVVPELLMRSTVPSIYFNLGKNEADAPMHGSVPKVVSFEAINDFVVLGVKQAATGTYDSGDHWLRGQWPCCIGHGHEVARPCG